MKKDRASDRFPPYLPLSYRAYLRVRKVYRQTLVRLHEVLAVRRGMGASDPETQDTARSSERPPVSNPVGAINKCVRWREDDLAQPEIRAIADRLLALREDLAGRGLRFTNTAGNFLAREFIPASERDKLWENAWLLHHSGVAPSHQVLDVGGASTAFSFYLASRGCRVAVVDNDWGNCGTLYNANYVARRMGWNLKAVDRDVECRLPFPDATFDRVFSVCVLEHLRSEVRQSLMREVGRVLKPGGIVGLTCDYDVSRPVLLTDRGLRFADRAKLERDVIEPSGLGVYGNTHWIDACSARSFLGALFLRKSANGPAG